MRSDDDAVAPATDKLPPYATVQDLAGYLKVSTRTIRRLIASGRMHALRTSAHGHLRVPRRSVVAFEAENEVTHG